MKGGGEEISTFGRRGDSLFNNCLKQLLKIEFFFSSPPRSALLNSPLLLFHQNRKLPDIIELLKKSTNYDKLDCAIRHHHNWHNYLRRQHRQHNPWHKYNGKRQLHFVQARPLVLEEALSLYLYFHPL